MSEFFKMGGYAFYVWFSYGLATIVLVYNWVIPIIRRKALLKKLTRRKQLNQN